MAQTHTRVRVGGGWLAVASALLIVGLVLHGPIAAEHGEQMRRIASASWAWSVAHWIAAASLSLYAVAGLIVLTAHSRLTAGGWTMTAWAVMSVGALWTLTTAVAEATVLTSAAISGNRELYDAWWAFAQGKATGFSFLALGVAVIAGSDARDAEGATPGWSAWTAMIAAIVAFVGWALGMWFGVALGNLLWIASAIAMSGWTAWFGVALMRSPIRASRPVEAS
jgi:hypothetical protein